VNKLHLKRSATDHLTLCGIWPDHSFVLMAGFAVNLLEHCAKPVSEPPLPISNDRMLLQGPKNQSSHAPQKLAAI
jgi:hypothetical protein